MKKNSLYWQVPLLVFLIAGTFYIARQNRKERLAEQQQNAYQRDEGQVFGTFYHVTYQATSSLKSSIDEALAEVDGEFSMFNPNSTVAAINRGEDPLRSSMFEEVYRLAQRVRDDTHGAFDITVAPLVNAWGFGFKNEQLPTPEQVDSLLKIRNQMDFSAIAKGYGCDMVARALEAHGVKDYMVEIGGEVVTRGLIPQQQPWKIGVSKPSEDALPQDGNELQAILTVSDAAMATSGNYRNFYYKGGRKYAHTIDPRTGYPVQHELLSATVLAPRCAVADAYATAFMVLGLDSARQVLKLHPEMQAYLIYTDADGRLTEWHSPSLQFTTP